MTEAELLRAALGLKEVDRAGWLRVGIVGPESVAAHSWGMAMAALVLCPPELDRLRVLTLCLVHDLPEVEVGDLTPHDGVSKAEKQAREATAAQALLGAYPELLGAWQEYEEGQTAEARFVKALDKLDMALQAQHYARERGADTAEFLRSARSALAAQGWASLLDGEP